MRIAFILTAILLITDSVPLSASGISTDLDNLVFHQGLRNYTFETSTSPQILKLNASEELGTTIKVQVRYLHIPKGISEFPWDLTEKPILETQIKKQLITILHAEDVSIESRAKQFIAEGPEINSARADLKKNTLCNY